MNAWPPVLLVLSSCFSLASGQAPLQDIGFSEATPEPDPDLVIVREKSYGAAGVDLSQYGIGSGSVDYVQSLYFRFFVDNDPNRDTTTGRVVFPPGVTILGVITNGAHLGGSVDDGQWTQTDAIFGIGTDPDAYSESDRGFDSGNAEFVCVISPQTLVFGLSVTTGIDDFRLIIDYGNSFPSGVDFDIGFYNLPTLQGVEPDRGYLIGEITNTIVPGSGDWDEAGSLIGIPLTSALGPTVGCVLTVQPEFSVYTIRDTADTFIDAFDVDLQIPGPGLVTIDGSIVGSPVGLTAGPDGLLYALAQGSGYAVVDPRGALVNATSIDNLAGNNADLTGLPGSRELYFARDTSGDTRIDRFDVDTLLFDPVSFAIPAADIGTPVGIADGADSLLYVVGSDTGFAAVDPVTGNVTNIGLDNKAGNYKGITGRPGTSKIYLLRDAGSTTSIDRYDFGSGMTDYDFATTSSIVNAVGITHGPLDLLYVRGRTTGFSAIDPDTGIEVMSNDCMDFSGINVDVAFTLPGPAGIYCTAKTNSVGCVPSIGSSGTPSVSAPIPFHVTAVDVVNNKVGILIYSLGSNSAPFQGGFLCVNTPIKRTAPQNSGGNPPPNDCSGTFSLDFNAIIQSGTNPNLMPCTNVYCQYWSRDLHDPAGFATSLTDALQFEIQL